MLAYSCPICLNEWPDTEALRSLSCGHIFCGSCIQQLLNISRPLCPSCRAGPIHSPDIRPVFINVEPRIPAPRNTLTSRKLPSTSLVILHKLHQLSVDIQSLIRDSGTDDHVVADGLLKLLAPNRCNETVKEVLLDTLETFMEANSSSAYGLARRGKVPIKPATSSSSRTCRETANTYERETNALEEELDDMRIDNLALSKRSQVLGSQLTATREELDHANEELDRVRYEQRELTRKHWIQRIDDSEAKREELARLKIELQQAREEARLNETKYRNLNVEVNGAIDTLTRSSEPLRRSISRSSYGW